MNHSRITAVQPHKAVEGGRISIRGEGLPVDRLRLPEIRVGDRLARAVYASPNCIDVIVPSGFARSGACAIRLDGESSDVATLHVGVPFATDLHQVDSPVCDRDGNLYVTYSGKRGQEVPVSVFRVRPGGEREAFASGIVNPTSLAIDPGGHLYVSSRFEGGVYRLGPDGSARPFATDLGVACGLAFAPDGTLFVGDRSGTILKVDRDGHASAFASLPASVAAFHLALGPDLTLYVTGPTLSTYDAVYRLDPDGGVTIRSQAFGRPQGLAFDANGTLFVVDALAGASGVYRLPEGGEPELVVSGPDLIGVAFGPDGGLFVCSANTVYRFQPEASSTPVNPAPSRDLLQ